MEASEYPEVRVGEGYAVGHLDDLGEGYGFRKVRKGLGVTAFGVNAIVMPGKYESGNHYHDEQEELYFVHRGTIEMLFGTARCRSWERAPSLAWTLKRCAKYATGPMRTPCTSAPAARMATWDGTGACPSSKTGSNRPPES